MFLLIGVFSHHRCFCIIAPRLFSCQLGVILLKDHYDDCFRVQWVCFLHPACVLISVNCSKTCSRHSARERYRTQRAIETQDQSLQTRCRPRSTLYAWCRGASGETPTTNGGCEQRINASQSAEDVRDVAMIDAEPPDPVAPLADPAPHASASASASVALKLTAAEASSEPLSAERAAPRRTNRRRNGPARALRGDGICRWRRSCCLLVCPGSMQRQARATAWTGVARK